MPVVAFPLVSEPGRTPGQVAPGQVREKAFHAAISSRGCGKRTRIGIVRDVEITMVSKLFPEKSYLSQ